MKSVLKAIPAVHPEFANVAQSFLSESAGNQEFHAPSALSLENIEFSSVSDFLFKYAPLEALLEKGRQRKIGLGRRALDSFACLWNVKIFVRKVEQEQGGLRSVDRLTSLLSTYDQPIAKPHPAWEAQHDAVLIQAIAKHGWIEREETAKAVAADPDVKLGSPFNETGSLSQSNTNTNALFGTAQRAALFLTANHGFLVELLGFDADMISRVYGLQKNVDESGATSWFVDEASLKTSIDESARLAAQAVAIPSRRDLAKRIKALCPLLTKNELSNKASASASPQLAQTDAFGFSVLNQDDPCNVLLTEILQALLKINFNDSMARLLISLAHDEAVKRHIECVRVLREQKPEAKAIANERGIGKIVQHIALVQRSVKATTRSKNVLRVILGKQPLLSRASNEALFPSDEEPKFEKKKARKASDGATGDRAITTGILIAAEGRPASAETKSSLELSAIETLLLSVVTSLGLPVFTLEENEQDSDVWAGGINKFALSWAGLCEVLETASKDWLGGAQDKLNSLRRAAAETSVEKLGAENMVVKAERDVKLKQLAASQAAHYSSHPEALAKKVIMLLEKLRIRMGPIGPAVTAKKRTTSENSLGPKVLAWLGKEVTRWGQSLRILDGQGRVYALSAVDFSSVATDDELGTVAILDQKACRCVFSQVAMLTRLRSVFAKYDNEEIKGRVSKAVTSCANVTGDRWDKEPEWWSNLEKSTIHNDISLLENLLECGFSGILCGGGTFRCENQAS
jgi:hypothetical protein